MASRFPDIEAFLHGYLTEQLAGVKVTSETTTKLQNELPYVQISRIGGADNTPAFDRPIVDIDSYASTRDEAAGLAGTVHDLIRFELAGSRVGNVQVGRVVTTLGPRALPYDNPAIRRFSATYSIVVHTF